MAVRVIVIRYTCKILLKEIISMLSGRCYVLLISNIQVSYILTSNISLSDYSTYVAYCHILSYSVNITENTLCIEHYKIIWK